MTAQRIPTFDLWQPGFGGATVTVYVAGTATLADLFTDEALSVAASNPQTLVSDANGAGKFNAPLYTGQSFVMNVSGTQTGIMRPPLYSLSGADASLAQVTRTSGSAATLKSVLDRAVHVEDFGTFLDASDPDASSTTNNTTLTSAIGIAAANGGGYVVIPPGTFTITSVTLAAGVVLLGSGRGVTTLQSETASEVVTLSGDRAGLERITLDGVSLQTGSVGVYAKAVDEIHFVDAEIKRFDTDLHLKGGRRNNWIDLYLDNANTCAKLHGDTDAGGGADGDQFRNNRWTGGKVSQGLTVGVDLSYEDAKCWHNAIHNVGFEDNTGTALVINGARHTNLADCWFSGNTNNLTVQDDDDTDNSDVNTVVGLFIDGMAVENGTISFTGKCQDVVLEGPQLEGTVTITLTQPDNAIIVRDGIEGDSVTISGDGTKWTRWRRTLKGTSAGRTTDGTATTAWSMELAPGQGGVIDIRVAGAQRNGVNTAQYHRNAKVQRPGSTLGYDGQTANFTVGETITGSTSGATALIQADSDSGATGTLTLSNISGTFEDNETITDESGGEAIVNGTISDQTAVVESASTIGTDHEDVSGWGVAVNANGGEVRVQVTGASSTTIDWVVEADALLT